MVDLGSGGGIDVFLAAAKAGPTGSAIGLDMSEVRYSFFVYCSSPCFFDHDIVAHDRTRSLECSSEGT